MEVLVPVLIYLVYSLLTALLKKMQNEYQEPELAPETRNGSIGEDLDKNRKEKQNKGNRGLEAKQNQREKKTTKTVQKEFESEPDQPQKIQLQKEEAEKKKLAAKEKIQELKEKQNENKQVKTIQDSQVGDLQNLSQQEWQKGIVLSEVLKPPRAKRPYQFHIDRR